MKTVLITGSTDGIGKLAALKLAEDRHEVILHGRNSEKLATTISEIREQAPSYKVSGVLSDLSDFASIDTMISELLTKHPKIDVLINNAGVFKSAKEQNDAGLELRFAVNYLAPIILTNGLLPMVKASTAPRILNVSSAAQETVSLKALQGREAISSQSGYAQSKLALTMWSFDFSKQHPDISTVAVNPGSLLNTKMVQEAYGRYWSSADKGADILYQLAVADKYSDCNGKYFDNDKGAFNEAHPDAYDPDKIEKLMATTDDFLKR